MNSRPLCIDLCCGLGGWTEGFIAEGYQVVGFDVERHQYGGHRYPGELVLQDILTLHGSQFRHAAVIVASSPCQKYSYMAQPWGRAKREIRWQEWERDSPFGDFRLNDLFEACFRIQREASEAAGHHIPMLVENVVGAQRWVGRAAWHFGSFYLWGDVPALMPFRRGMKNNGGSWFGQPDGQTLERNDPRDLRRDENSEWRNAAAVGGYNHPGKQFDGLKNPGMTSWSDYGKPDYKPQGFNVTNAQKYREGLKHGGDCFNDPAWPGKQGGVKQGGSGPEWFDSGICKHSSRSNSRKAASALIAKIPFELSSYIARVYHP